MRSAPAAALPRVFRREDIDARRCVRYLWAAVRTQFFLPQPSRARPRPQELLCWKARPSFLVLPLRRSLPGRPPLPRRIPRCPLGNAFLPPTFLRGRDESQATARFPFHAATATTHRPPGHPQRRPPRGDAARSGRSAPLGWRQLPAPQHQTCRAELPRPTGIAAQSIRSSPIWIAVSRVLRFPFGVRAALVLSAVQACRRFLVILARRWEAF